MLQRKNAIENGGTLPATPRARIMLETWAVATSRKPSRAQHFVRPPACFSWGSLMGGGVAFRHHAVERISHL